jgi:hypothetical protein
VLDRVRAWATVGHLPTRDGLAWFKACAPVQAFEPRLTAVLAQRWPDRVARVLAHDEARAWLLTADAGDDVGKHGNDPEIWLRALPSYAELQRGEVQHVTDHLAHGVVDMRAPSLPASYDAFLAADLPLKPGECDRLRRFAGAFARLCDELAAADPTASIQHDDLHLRSLYLDGDALRVLDWGDAVIAHPFASLVVTFRFLERENGMPADDPWFDRLRDAYLEPWGHPNVELFNLAMRVGMVAQMIGWQQDRAVMSPDYRRAFDEHFSVTLRLVLARAVDPVS